MDAELKPECGRKVGWGIFFILGSVFVSYLPALEAGFVWDDYFVFVDNPNMKDLEGLKRFWTTPAGVYYPLTASFFWLMQRLWGLEPFPYHLVNVILHTANALLIWRLLHQFRVRGAWLAATIFALHPVHVESVAWVTELKNLLPGLFLLASILCYVKAEARRGGVSDTVFYGCSILLFASSLLAKPAAVMYPVVLLVYHRWRERRFQLISMIRMIPFFLLSLVAALWTIWVEVEYGGAKGADLSFSFLERFAIAGKAILFYLGKLFWPHPLMLIYPRWQIRPLNALDFRAWLWILLGVLVCLRSRRTWGKYALAALGSFFIFLLPVLGFVNQQFMRLTFVSDHFQYLASIGPIVGFAAPVSSNRLPVTIRFPSFAATIVILCVLTWRDATAYDSQEVLLQDALKKNPAAWLAHNNLGNLRMKQARVDEAIEHYRKALELNPNSSKIHYNLGAALAFQDRNQEALEHFLTALRLKPEDPMAHFQVGYLLGQRGQRKEAVHHYLGPTEKSF